MSCSCCCWGCAACVGADLVGQFKPASAQRGDNKIAVFMTWPRPQRAWAVLRLNAVACLSKTQNAHFYYFALRDLQFSNFPSAENKVTPRHGDPLGLATHTHQHCNLWCTFDLQQFYLRISHIATVTAACKESQILAEVPVATWNYKYVSWKTKWKTGNQHSLNIMLLSRCI